jgi:Zn-dependent peptidase ImmA (M78 family)/transcriptional regulator with XRE-family HTH domain
MSDALEFARMIGERIRAARTEADLSQETLSSQLGFNDRQTLSTIESGKRAVSAEELVRFAEVLKQPLDFFTDPYLLVEKGDFSYRTTSKADDLQVFEGTTRRLLAANHRFRMLLDEPVAPVVGQLREVTPQTTPDQANGVGYRLARAWTLGSTPAEKLGEMLESKLHVMVLYVDAPAGVSGAACRLKEGDAVLINRNEPGYRQNWTLGHETFHLLTWDAMPPEKIDREQAKDAEKPKVEKLADAFTAGLLMPLVDVHLAWEESSGEIHQRILKCADKFQVSGQAMFYRLKLLGALTTDEVAKVDLEKLARKKTGQALRPLYSREFVRRLHDVLDRGLMTVLLACQLLETDMDGLKSLFREHGFGVPFDL